MQRGLQALLALVVPHDDTMVSRLLACVRTTLNLESVSVRLTADRQEELSVVDGEPHESFEAAHHESLPLGLDERLGSLTCTSRRDGFPSADERTFMQLAAYKLALALHEARTRHTQAVGTTRSEREQLSRSLGLRQLLATVAHEINQPLAAIVSNANACSRWLSHEPPNAAEAQAAAQRIPHDAERASGLVARARDVTRTTSSQREPLSVESLVRSVAAVVRDEASRRQVALHVVTQTDSSVEGDRAELEQLLLLLIDNAFEAMASQSGARVLTLHVDRDANDGVLLSVSDTGPGITPEPHTRIFAPLFSSKPGRLGLGLSIGRAIVQAHDGKLWAEPRVGQGATFCVTLPRHSG